MRLVPFLVALLAGCANQTFQQGMESANRGDFYEARSKFNQCFRETGDPVCANNAAVVTMQLGDTVTARELFTVAARLGNPQAIENLRRNGWPIPAADLQQLVAQQQAARNQQMSAACQSQYQQCIAYSRDQMQRSQCQIQLGSCQLTGAALLR